MVAYRGLNRRKSERSNCLYISAAGGILLRTMVEFIEGGVALFRLAFRNGCELCDAVQRVHGSAGEADDRPLASGSPQVETTVGGLGKSLEERPEA